MSVVGVIGAGVIGTGVADNAARSGHDVILIDDKADALSRSLALIERDCRMSRLYSQVAIDAAKVLARITPSRDMGELAGCELVVENVTERWDIKRRVWEELDASCPSSTIFVANTSAIPITRLASVTSHPDRVIGVHFMNPVPMKSAVELIPGRLTSEETVSQTREFVHSLGKEAILVNDACGFVSNRILHLAINEAAFLVYEGVATPETVDKVFRTCFGHPMGLLETADLIGIDTILHTIEVLYEHFADSKYRPSPLLKEMAAAGLLGRKSGRGFYAYETLGRPVTGEITT